jgi:predicted  nucleic acid-binding Zn-ribbon protein
MSEKRKPYTQKMSDWLTDHPWQCPECGAVLLWQCPECGAILPLSQETCDHRKDHE